jgi:aspartate/methionine/tyrosine aminotransferase
VKVIVPDLDHESFSRHVKFAGGIPVPVYVKEEESFRLNLKAVEQAITDKTKMLVINTPSNPTGTP